MTRSAFLKGMADAGILPASEVDRLLRTAPLEINEGEPLPQDLDLVAPLDISSREDGEKRMCRMCGSTWAVPPKEEG